MVWKKKSFVVDENYNTIQHIEEIIARSHQQEPIDVDAPLEKKTNNKELLARLLEIEQSIIEKARAKGIIK